MTCSAPNAIMACTLAVGGMIACVAIAAFLGRFLRVLRRALRPAQLVSFAVLAIVATIWGRKVGTITFPRTDPTISYLVDHGSYVTNDYVHVDFSRIIVPDSATLFLDRRPLDSISDDDWETFATGVFAEWSPPIEVPCPAATNWDWIVYTDWTPGPSVQTNGVWHAFWGRDQRERRFYIPIRTAVRLDGDTIATPKSKEDSHNENH